MSSPRKASAPGKIILSGEYAMVFGFPGIAVPAKEHMCVEFTPKKKGGLTVIWGKDDFHPEWAMFAGQIAETIGRLRDERIQGELFIETNLPLGKGMGSSTALVIAIARVLAGEDSREIALRTEDELNPGHSGMDFAVIWENRPILFRKGSPPKPIVLPDQIVQNAKLIDTGMPNEPTHELVAWVKSKYPSATATTAATAATAATATTAAGTSRPGVEDSITANAIETIGQCTERILAGEDLKTVIRDHTKAQVALGVVPQSVQELITNIESKDGAAKVIGAGGRTGGGGMVLHLY